MALQWNDVKVNFNDANYAMANAREGISKAGTVFGELRKAILDEEQKAVENAYKQKVFDENIRQFGLQHALNQDKLAEQIRSNQATEAFRDKDLAARREDARASRAIQARSADIQARSAGIAAQRLRLEMDAYNQKLADQKAYSEAVKFVSNLNTDAISKQVDSLGKDLHNVNVKLQGFNNASDETLQQLYGTSDRATLKDKFTKERDSLQGEINKLNRFAKYGISAQGRLNALNEAYAMFGGIGPAPSNKVLEQEAQFERQTAQANQEAARAEHAKEKTFIRDLSKWFMDNVPNLDSEGLAALNANFNAARKAYPNLSAYDAASAALYSITDTNYKYNPFNDSYEIMDPVTFKQTLDSILGTKSLGGAKEAKEGLSLTEQFKQMREQNKKERNQKALNALDEFKKTYDY